MTDLTSAERVREILSSEGKISGIKYYIQTLGCQQNEADSERIAGLCEAMGYEEAEKPDEASLLLINTCAIREHAETRALSFIGEFKHVKDKDPDTIIGVCGCMTAVEEKRERLKRSYPYVNFTLDTGSYSLLPSLVENALKKRKRTFVKTEEYTTEEGLPVSRKGKGSAWLSVMYGCNNFCSYCIVPYVRGRERSRDRDVILAEAKEIIASGARDITLLGQNVNSYGKDREGNGDIASLMRDICSLDGDFTLRFMTSHPKDVSDELIKTVAEEKKTAKHFHLPVQSGSDRILKEMNRKYDVSHYLGIVDRLREAYPDISLTTDIIVGFPGETDEDFNATMDLLEKVRFDMVFSFIYSPRTGTPAAKMENRVPSEVAHARYQTLSARQDVISRERNERFVGREVTLFCESISRTNGDMLTCRGDMARPVHVPGNESDIGTVIRAKITSCGPYSLDGERI